VNATLRAPRRDAREYFFDAYMTYKEIVRGIEHYADKHSHVKKSSLSGLSYYGTEIIGVKINTGTKEKNIVFLECGIHAREWISTAFCSYLIHEFATNAEKHKTLLDRYEFHIYPSVNPDGYQNTKVYRFWRKNMKPNPGSCVGTDLNRNFETGPHCGVGTSKNPCDEIFCGQEPFSEPETQAIRDTVLPLKGRIEYYISFHSFGLMWMFPFSYTDKVSAHHDELLSKAKLGAEAITRFSGTVYRVGTIASTIYKVTGGSIDWAYEAGIKNSYVLELQPKGSGSASGFLLPANKIIPTCKETLVGVQTMLLA